MNQSLRAITSVLLALGCAFSPIAARANVVIAGTRIIFPAKDGEVTVRLTNQNTTPALVEAWVDGGDPNSTPDKVNTPFLITPPLFRMEPQRDQSLRILFTRSEQPLPSDRESVFWLNVLEIPPKPTGEQTQGKNYLQLAIRSRLKLFYRPDGLASEPSKAAGSLTFKATPSSGTDYALLAHNPSPYYVTITSITLSADGHTYKVDAGMVAPMADLRLSISQLTHAPGAGSAISFDSINDFGATVALKSSISP